MIRVLLEGRDAPVYHCTDYFGLDAILDSDSILASTRVNGGVSGVCVTRDKNYYVKSLVKSYVQIALDQRRISQRYKIVPYAEKDYRKDRETHESEERIVTKKLTKVKDYILYVDMSPKEIQREEAYLSKVVDGLDLSWKGIEDILENADNASDDLIEASGLFLVPYTCHKHNVPLGPNLSKIVKQYNIGK